MYNPNEFVNRDAESDAFTEVLDHPHLRLLFLHGPEGIGKTSLIGRLRQDADESGAVSVIVDFKDKSLDEPEEVLGRLQERLGGEFASSLEQAGFTVLQQVSRDTLGDLLSQLGTTAPGRVDISHSEEINVEGDLIGGFKIVLNNSSITLPFGDARYLQKAVERRLNKVFPEALKGLANNNGRVILFFDHFEKAKDSVIQWLRHHLFNLYLEEPNDIVDVWIVVSGREIPYAEEVDGWDYILYNQPVKPLQEEFIRYYWLEKCHLDPEELPNVIRDSEGIPLVLLWLAKEATARREGQTV